MCRLQKNCFEISFLCHLFIHYNFLHLSQLLHPVCLADQGNVRFPQSSSLPSFINIDSTLCHPFQHPYCSPMEILGQSITAFPPILPSHPLLSQHSLQVQKNPSGIAGPVHSTGRQDWQNLPPLQPAQRSQSLEIHLNVV